MNYDGGVWLRSSLACQARLGICKLCYGVELGWGKVVQHGESIGILAAQSIGQPGTQLTLRTFQELTNIKGNTMKEA